MIEKLKTCQRCGSLEHTAACGTVVSKVSERDEFEAWAKADGYQIDRVPSQPSLYNWASTQCCWEAWQAARTQQAVPALIQWRMRPTWLPDGEGWTKWEDCSPASAQDKERTPLLHSWQYEVRRLYLAAPQPSQEPRKYQD